MSLIHCEACSTFSQKFISEPMNESESPHKTYHPSGKCPVMHLDKCVPKHTCSNCMRKIKLKWLFCPWCSHSIGIEIGDSKNEIVEIKLTTTKSTETKPTEFESIEMDSIESDSTESVEEKNSNNLSDPDSNSNSNGNDLVTNKFQWKDCTQLKESTQLKECICLFCQRACGKIPKPRFTNTFNCTICNNAVLHEFSKCPWYGNCHFCGQKHARNNCPYFRIYTVHCNICSRTANHCDVHCVQKNKK